jgi:Prp8 binding protein
MSEAKESKYGGAKRKAQAPPSDSSNGTGHNVDERDDDDTNDEDHNSKRPKVTPAASSAPSSSSSSSSSSASSSSEATTIVNSSQLVVHEPKKQLILSDSKGQQQVRTSSLLAPIMLLTGHGAAVYTAKFNPKGDYIASGSADKTILLWRVFGECENWAILKGHTGNILDLSWSKEGDFLYTASADKTGAIWDVEQCVRLKRLKDHESFVNSVCASTGKGDQLVVTGSDDCTAMVWDQRVRGPQKVLESEYQVLAVAFNGDNSQVFTGGIDNSIKCWDLRTEKVLYSLDGHLDSISGLRLSPDGNYLASNGMDHTVRTWDVRPYAPTSRAVAVYEGARHDLSKNLLKVAWSPDGARLSAGSSDRLVNIWDVASTRLLYKLPGHTGSVVEVDFHPKEPVILSCGEDKKIYLGEINP